MVSGNCPVCDAPMRPDAPEIARCPSCGYYKSSFAAGSGTGIEGLEALRRSNFETVLDRLARHRELAGASLLEVGCAKGWFIEAAAKRGMIVRGIEPELANQRIASGKGFDVRHGFFPEAAAGSGPYDIVAFNDVFEHLPDPVAAIRAVADLLKPGGLASINIPSSQGALFRIARVMRRLGFTAPWARLWQMGLASPHISYFDAVNLTQLAERHTVLRKLDAVRLATMAREGLHTRVKSASPGLAGDVMFGAVWGLWFVIDALPADVVLVVLEKRA
jgi:SAM-dependent methyltransferase